MTRFFRLMLWTLGVIEELGKSRYSRRETKVSIYREHGIDWLRERLPNGSYQSWPLGVLLNHECRR